MKEVPDTVYFYEYKPDDVDDWIPAVSIDKPNPDEIFTNPNEYVRNVHTYVKESEDE